MRQACRNLFWAEQHNTDEQGYRSSNYAAITEQALPRDNFVWPNFSGFAICVIQQTRNENHFIPFILKDRDTMPAVAKEGAFIKVMAHVIGAKLPSGHRICVLRDGLVMQVGSPSELYERPNSIFVAGFIGSPKMNFINGAIARDYNCHTLGIRSEHIVVDNASPVWSGEVVHAENLGSDNYLFVDIGSEEPVLVRQEGKTEIPWGARIGIRPLPENIHRFNEQGRPIV